MKFSFAKMIDPSLLLSPARSIRSYSDVSLLSLCYLCFLIVWLFGERQVSDTAIIMTFMAAVFLAHTFVMNRLDYCSSLLAGLNGVRIELLERIHRADVRPVVVFAITDRMSL